MSIEIPLEQALTVEQAIAAANAAKIGAQQALASIPAVIDAEVGPASQPYILQSESARDAALAAKSAAETARDNALATERRVRSQDLGDFANDAAAVAAAASASISIVIGTSYWNTTTQIKRICAGMVYGGGPPTVAWVDEDADAQTQRTNAGVSAVAAAASQAVATQKANDAAEAAGSAIQILAGAGSEDYTINGICALSHGAVLSFPKGLSVLGGNLVPTSTLITPSTAAKTVFNPDGTVRRTATNELAQSWKDGTRFGFLEANGAINYWANPESFAAGPGCTAANAANSLFGMLNRCTLTATDANFSIISPILAPVTDGQVVTQTMALRNGTGSWQYGGLYGSTSGWGANGDTTCVILSGPGAVVQNYGGLWNFSGLSNTQDTVIRWTRTYRTSEDAEPLIFSLASVGQTVSFGRPQLELGYGSSYIVAGASPTARAPDIWQLASAFAAQQLGQNSTFIIRATLLNGWASAPDIYQLLGDDTSSMFYADLSGFPAICAWDSYTAHNIVANFPTSVPTREIGAVITTSKDGRRKVCVNGGEVITDNFPQYHDDTSLTLGGGSFAYRSDLAIKEIIGMAAYVDNDDALRAHARAYA